MNDYQKPEIYTDADWDMVRGYMRAWRGLPAQIKTAAYMHGYRNGEDDRSGKPRERADMIPGTTPQPELIARANS